MSNSRWEAAFPQASVQAPPQPQHPPRAHPIQVPPEKTIGAFRPSIARPPVPVYIPQPIPPQFGRPPKGPSVAPLPRPVPGPVQASAPAPLPSPAAGPPHQQPAALGRGPALAPNQQTKRPAPQGPPPPPPPPPKRRKNYFYPNFDLTRLPEMPLYLTAMPEICKGIGNEPEVRPPSEFSHSMKLLPLSDINHIEIWTTQVEEMAKSCGCYRELTTRFGVFPKPGTVEAFVCQTRYTACWRILHETISGPVWSYMRSLGYSKIPVFKGPDGTQWQPAPVDAFYYARQAGHRLLVPGTPTQSRMEIMLMVEELRLGREADYPSPKAFAQGHLWMKGILDNLIRNGDRQVCESLYDQKPDWAPGPDVPGPSELRWNLGGFPLLGKPRQVQRDVHAAGARENQQARAGQGEQSRAAQQGGQGQAPFPVPHFHQMQQQSAPHGVSPPQVEQRQQPPQPPQPAPTQQTEVITIADSPTPSSVPPTPPPLLSKGDEEGDENNDDDDNDDDDNDESEETFHDAEEGGDVDEDAEDANDVVMTNVDLTNSATTGVEETEGTEESGESDDESEEE